MEKKEEKEEEKEKDKKKEEEEKKERQEKEEEKEKEEKKESGNRNKEKSLDAYAKDNLPASQAKQKNLEEESNPITASQMTAVKENTDDDKTPGKEEDVKEKEVPGKGEEAQEKKLSGKDNVKERKKDEAFSEKVKGKGPGGKVTDATKEWEEEDDDWGDWE